MATSLNNFVELSPPGTYCLNQAFLEMISPLSQIETFIEIGPGEGNVSKLLCSLGLKGIGIDFSQHATKRLAIKMQKEIEEEKYRIIYGDFSSQEFPFNVDLVFCIMVLEHVDDDLAFLKKMKKLVRKGGKIIIGVPARMDKWGIEDDVSGHFRRYERETLKAIFISAGLQSVRIYSTGVPVSNILFRLSNLAVMKSRSSSRLGLSKKEQTEKSGIKDIPYKNIYPKWAKIFLNKWTMVPFLYLQRYFYDSNIGLTLMACAVNNFTNDLSQNFQE